MRSAAIMCSLLAAASGCGTDCEPSANVRLQLDGSDPAMASVTQLFVGVSIDGGPRQPPQRIDLAIPLTSGRALLLQPTAAITAPSYLITVDVTALSADQTALLFGKISQTVGSSACNRLALTLTGPGDMSMGGDDQSVSPDDLSGLDLAGADQSMPPDLAAPDLAPCVATTPDEDGDGRGDACDVCAANADPTIIDGDSDGVPDVCDPAPVTAGNRVVYFQPFNAMPAGWTGTFSVGGGAATITGSGGAFSDVTTAASDPSAALPAGVWMQTFVTPSAVTSDIDGGIRVALWKTVGSAGYLCIADFQSIGDPALRIREIGGGQSSATLGNGGLFASGQRARVRMWQQGTTIGCEMAKPDGSGPVMVTRTIATAPAGPLRPGVGVGFESYSNSGSVTAQYTSVFAVSYP